MLKVIIQRPPWMPSMTKQTPPLDEAKKSVED